MIKSITFAAVFLFSSVILSTEEKPKILIIGDSISIGYTPFVQEKFGESAIVVHNPGNAQHTGTGLDKIDEWIGEEDWDIIQFNWGLWDLCYRHPDSKEYGNRDKINGTLTYSLEEYQANLDALVTKIQKLSDAKLIFVSTTYVPENEAGRFKKDPKKYNQVAKKVMKEHGVLINDLYNPSISIHKSNGLGDNDVHYTPEGYEQLAEIIYEFLDKEIR
ncbi:SGNH/GDSL hydrolase family protein [Algoriphagus pacificus]|uniref:SGNH/GDSL hydrolase family protein n=1 Tax=Algoriphagus pacificus TaxID=2811234 RepID=A0ABS3CIL0_9BACT|nr:SGNH/GDSL hydrolase family protein [Algoriphagus pacificus]MBN7815484.1 SGNH/GDSL hydrolase family protein [Algoriphagus pacificus]